jgi:cobalamin synthase
MSYLPPERDGGHMLAPRDNSGSDPSATAVFVLAIIYASNLFVLLVTTITFAFKFRSRRRTNGRQGEGDTLGLVLIFGELCALSNAILYGVYDGFMALYNIVRLNISYVNKQGEKNEE